LALRSLEIRFAVDCVKKEYYTIKKYMRKNFRTKVLVEYEKGYCTLKILLRSFLYRSTYAFEVVNSTPH